MNYRKVDYRESETLSGCRDRLLHVSKISFHELTLVKRLANFLAFRYNPSVISLTYSPVSVCRRYIAQRSES